MRHKLAEDIFTLSIDRIEAAAECRDLGEHRRSNHHFRVAVLLARLSRIVGWETEARRNVRRTLSLIP